MTRGWLIAMALLGGAVTTPAWGQATAPDVRSEGALLDRALQLVEADPAGARRLVEQAAAGGDAEALNVLATFLLNGIGGPADAARARELLERAVAGESTGARLNMAGILIREGEEAGLVRAAALLTEASKDPKNGWLALYPLGRLKLFGIGMPQDLPGGSAMLEQALARDPGNADAAFLVARAHQNGWNGRPADLAKAAQLFRQAADLGDARGARYYGAALLTGQGVEEDGLEAYAWFRKAAEAGDVMAMIDVAVMLAIGEKGVPQNATEARSWYQRAAERGSAHALRGLGGMLLQGEGGAPEIARGLAYLEIAGEAGDPAAKAALGQLGSGGAERSAIDTAKQAWLARHGAPRLP